MVVQRRVFRLHVLEEFIKRGIVVLAVPLAKFFDVTLLYGFNKLPFKEFFGYLHNQDVLFVSNELGNRLLFVDGRHVSCNGWKRPL